MTVKGDVAAAPLLPAPYRLHPGYQQYRREQVHAQIHAGVGRQVSQVGHQPRAAQHEYPPEIPPPEKSPTGQIPGHPGSAHNAEGEGHCVDADRPGTGGL